jgi:nitrous oxidase accessory protein
MRLLILFFILISFGLKARTFHVGKNEIWTSIKEALSFVERGDTVLIAEGLYREGNIVVEKPIHIIGINYPIIDGEGKYEIFSVKCDSVSIEGFEITSTGISSTTDFAAIKLYDLTDVLIQDNRILKSFFGIYAQNSRRCTIQRNVLKAEESTEQRSANGIHFWKCDDMRVIANDVRGHRDGIYFEFVTNSIIWRNKSKENIRYGLHFMFSNNDTYVANIFEKNGAGVAVMFSNHVSMFSNIFKMNWGDSSFGILLKEISDSHIEGNQFLNNTSGIFMEGASRVKMYRNRFHANGWGLKIQSSCMDIELTRNDFTSNTFDVGSNGTLMLNHFHRNYWDKYEGYDLNKDLIGDVPYRPVSLFSMLIEKSPDAAILYRSLAAGILDKSERIVPSLTPEKLKDEKPSMKPNVR